MQDILEVIEMFPKEKYYEVLRSAKSIPKRENTGTGIDQFVMYFDGKIYKLGIFVNEGISVKG